MGNNVLLGTQTGLGDKKEPLAQVVGELKVGYGYRHWIYNVAAAGLVFAMLVVAYNWKDFYKSITRTDVITNSITILGDDGKPQFVIDKYGVCKVNGTNRIKILDNVAGTVELNVDRVTAKGITAKAIDADVSSANSFIFVDSRGNKIKVEDHLNTRKVGDAP